MNSDSDAEFEQMLAEAEEPKPATAAASEEGVPLKEDDPAVPVSCIYDTVSDHTFHS